MPNVRECTALHNDRALALCKRSRWFRRSTFTATRRLGKPTPRHSVQAAPANGGARFAHHDGPVRSTADTWAVSTDRQPRQSRIIPGWGIRAWAWAADATDGISWLVGLCAFVSVLGFVFYPVDLHDRNQARALQTTGEWVTAQDVEVHVDRVTGKGGGYLEVDAVRIRLADDPSLVELENVNAAADSIWEDLAEGWQEPTQDTGYMPPLDVRVARDSDGSITTGMAKADYEYWTQDNGDPEFGLTLGIGGALAAAFFLALNHVRLTLQSRRRRARRDQRQAEHQARVAKTGKRS